MPAEHHPKQIVNLTFLKLRTAVNPNHGWNLDVGFAVDRAGTQYQRTDPAGGRVKMIDNFEKATRGGRGGFHRHGDGGRLGRIRPVDARHIG